LRLNPENQTRRVLLEDIWVVDGTRNETVAGDSLGLGAVMTVNLEQFQELCSGVWRDRATIIKGRGFLSGEAALLRAVYWRLSKTGVKAILSAENYGTPRSVDSYQLAVNCMLEMHGHPRFNGAGYLAELIQRYKNDLRDSC